MISGASKNSFSSSSSLMSPLPEQHWSTGRKASFISFGCIYQSLAQQDLLNTNHKQSNKWSKAGEKPEEIKGLRFHCTRIIDLGESIVPLLIAGNHVSQVRIGSPRTEHFTFTRTSAAGSVCRQHCGAPEGPLQVVMLLRQLLQGFFQADPLVSFILQWLLPFFTMGLC